MRTGSLSEYAAHAGVSAPYVTKLKKAGRIVFVDVDGKQRVNFELTDRLVLNTSDVGRSRNGGNAKRTREASAGDTGFPESRSASQERGDRGESPVVPAPVDDPVLLATRQAKAKTAVYEAMTAELNHKKAIGELVDKKAAERTVFDMFRTLRDHVFQAPQRAAARCMGVTDMREIERVIDEEVRKGFIGWEQKMQARLGAKGTT